MLRLCEERLMNIRCCCEQDAAAYRKVLYPNHYSEAPGDDRPGGVGPRVRRGDRFGIG